MDAQRPILWQHQEPLGQIVAAGLCDAQVGLDVAFQKVQEFGIAGALGGEDGEAKFIGKDSNGVGDDFAAALAAFQGLGDGGNDGKKGGGEGGLGVVVEGAEGGGGHFGCAEEENAGNVVVGPYWLTIVLCP